MEIFDAHNVTDNRITLKSEKQLESLLECIRGEKEIMLRWEDDDSNKMSKVLITEGLMPKVKDGRLVLESRNEDEEEE